MQILVISDTHGSIFSAYEIYNKLCQTNRPDLVVHCGDFYMDAIELQNKITSPVVWVKGNCDGAYGDNNYKIVETEYGNIYVSHGHTENISNGMETLYNRAIENHCVAAFFGHTHRAVSTECNGIHLVNPGSLTKPRDGSSGTFAIVTTGSEYFHGQIYNYNDFISCGLEAKSKRKKVVGGKLKDIFNYSDRF